MINVSEGIDVSRTSQSKECDICHYWHFLIKGFKFQPNVFNGRHDLLTMFINLSNIAVLNIRSADYLCIVRAISKSDAINLMQNKDLTEKSRTL